LDGVGDAIRNWYGNTDGPIEQEFVLRLWELTGGVTVPESWSCCRPARAKVIGACQNPISSRKEIEYLRQNVTAWRDLEKEIDTFERRPRRDGQK
jgi:hypothetical protein